MKRLHLPVKIVVFSAVFLMIFAGYLAVTLLSSGGKVFINPPSQLDLGIVMSSPSASLICEKSKFCNPPNTSFELSQQLECQVSDLSSVKIQGFLNYLRNPPRAETAMDPAAEYFNNVISLLLMQSDPVTELSLTLLGIVNNTSTTLLMRDYALQHFFQCWNRESIAATRLALEQSLKCHAQDASSPLQGVALLTTSRLLEQGKPVTGPNGEKLTPIGASPTPNPLSISKPTSFTGVELVAIAMRVTTDSTAAPVARACAFNVLLNMKVRQAIEPARQVLQIGKTPDFVRCSALAVVGVFGDLTADRSTLDAIPLQPVDVRQAASSALSQLTKHSSPQN